MKDFLEKRDGEQLPRVFWLLLWSGLGLSLLAQALVHVHGYFGFDETFGFYAAYGLVSCVLMVIGAKLLGLFLKRRQDYYPDE